MNKDNHNQQIEHLNRIISAYDSDSVAVVANTGDANSYGVVANLGRAGVKVVSVDYDPNNITFRSKYSIKALSPDYNHSEQDYVNFILDLGKVFKTKPALFITGDRVLMILLRHRKQLEEYYLIPHAPFELAEKLADKLLFYQMAKLHEVSHPDTYLPNKREELESVCDQLDYPYIIKPAKSQTFSQIFGNKCLKVNNGTELLDCYDRVAEEETGGIIVQKEIAGTERYLVYTYFSRDSRPLAISCYKKIRIYPIDYGNACVCKTCYDQEVVDLCIEFLKKINYQGLAEAEIQRDERDGRLRLIEINARTTTEARLSEGCGVNMEFIAFRDLHNEEQNLVINRKYGVLWIDLLKDIIAVFTSDGYLASGRITIWSWLKSFRGKRVYAYFTWADPYPSIVLFYRFIRMYLFKTSRLTDLWRTIGLAFNKNKHPSKDMESGL